MATDTQQQVLPRPFLKWAGGKSQLIPQYRRYFPKDFQTYYEPFLGGGAIFFALCSKSAILTDINSELINAYLCVRDKVEPLINLLKVHQDRHDPEYYYEIRSDKTRGNYLSPNVERAARLIYLNKTCFNGLYRENSKGEFNVPIGKYKNPKICNPDLLYAVSLALQNTQILVRPFEGVLSDAQGSDDFVYFDPPYQPLSPTSNFTAYSRSAFSQDDQMRLKEVFTKLAKRGVKVMLSNSDVPFIRELYSDFSIHTISASRSINSNASKRGRITEVLVTSY
ncbi:MAG: DNA adenine methylase [Kastovskya adunca ATA6-11-RM4]|nr:DNA adenine methylase [Kastovskya adunca ATA6-11-RM4]